LNSATLIHIRDVLYELHVYFDTFDIAVVACPCLTRSPYNFDFRGLSGNMYIEEMIYTRDMLNNIASKTGPMRLIPFRPELNFFCDHRPGMVLKIRAKGRRTDHNIITLIQGILHKRFSYKMGLGGVLLKKERHVTERSSKSLNEQCSTRVSYQTAIYTIVNNPVLVLGQQNDRLFSHIFSENKHDLFDNDMPEAEYIGYFNVAEKVTIMVVTNTKSV